MLPKQISLKYCKLIFSYHVTHNFTHLLHRVEIDVVHTLKWFPEIIDILKPQFKRQWFVSRFETLEGISNC